MRRTTALPRDTDPVRASLVRMGEGRVTAEMPVMPGMQVMRSSRRIRATPPQLTQPTHRRLPP